MVPFCEGYGGNETGVINEDAVVDSVANEPSLKGLYETGLLMSNAYPDLAFSPDYVKM